MKFRTLGEAFFFMYDTHGLPLEISLDVLERLYPNRAFSDLDVSGFIKAAKESGHFDSQKCWRTLEFGYLIDHSDKRPLAKYLLGFHYGDIKGIA